MKNYELQAIGYVKREKDRLIITLAENRLIAAMKNLSFFSHATFIFSDGISNLCIRVAEMLEVDEKRGKIILAIESGLLEGK
ncbi:hypothetical protein [Enterococcus sp. UD-01]|jgi:hypothetical protein|uniref:hypothetical protein n=1 Tax=Enterococcus sp. UD-01 TaxID=3373911 RepID=UPI003838B0D5